jgi:hypothetical protein
MLKLYIFDTANTISAISLDTTNTMFSAVSLMLRTRSPRHHWYFNKHGIHAESLILCTRCPRYPGTTKMKSAAWLIRQIWCPRYHDTTRTKSAVSLILRTRCPRYHDTTKTKSAVSLLYCTADMMSTVSWYYKDEFSSITDSADMMSTESWYYKDEFRSITHILRTWCPQYHDTAKMKSAVSLTYYGHDVQNFSHNDIATLYSESVAVC